ncbi:MAG: hypothetical protein ABIV36_06855 [Sphingobium limneticum]
MSYEKRTDIGVLPGETAVQLDTESSDLVAVSCPSERDALSNTVNFSPRARWIDGAGVTRTDSAGRDVTTTLTHGMAADRVNELGSAVVVKECLLLVLGEPLTPDPEPEHAGVTLIPWSADVVARCSIRNAIASASVAVPSAGDVL